MLGFFISYVHDFTLYLRYYCLNPSVDEETIYVYVFFTFFLFFLS